ncbi:MAG: hypothetical protein GF400_06285 [Candidatus Eisenbacteria bacterium]|nr:hypothetical protein [Candidatus Eisenbacteria bacterium]
MPCPLESEEPRSGCDEARLRRDFRADRVKAPCWLRSSRDGWYNATIVCPEMAADARLRKRSAKETRLITRPPIALALSILALPALTALLLSLDAAEAQATCVDYESHLHFQHAEPFTNSNPVVEMDRHSDLIAVCRQSGGIEIYDVSDPYGPFLVGDNAGLNDALNVMWCPPYLFVPDSGNRILTVDATDPSEPVLCGSQVTNGYPYCVAATREVLVVGTEFGLDIFRYGSPCYPTLIDSVSMHGPVHDVMMGLEDQYAFCAMGTDGLGVVEVDTTSGPTLLTVEPTDHEFRDLVVRDHYVFVTRIDGHDAWLDVYDVTTPSSPSLVTSVELNRLPEDMAYAHYRFWLPHDYGVDVVSVEGTGYENPVLERMVESYGDGQAVCMTTETLILGSREHEWESDWAGLECFALGDLDVVAPEATIPVPSACDIVGMGPYALVTSWSCSLHVVDCATNGVASREYIGSEPMCVALNGSEDAIVSTYWSEAYHVDVSDPLDPVRGAVGDAGFGSLGMDCLGGRAYQATGPSGVRVLDVSSPDTISTVCQTVIDDAKVMGVHAVEGYCLASGHDSATEEVSLWTLDTSYPDTVVVVGEWSSGTQGSANGVQVAGDLAYLCGWERFYVLDISDPLSPATLGATRVPGKMWDVAVGEGYAYVSGEQGDYFVVDVRDPSDPKVVGQYCAEPVFSLGLCAWGENVYVLGTNEVFVFGRHCGDATGVVEPDDGDPQTVGRLHCAPNPSTADARFSFVMPCESDASLRVYDAAGRLVARVLERRCPAGPVSVDWDGRDEAGNPVAAGVYFARLETAGEKAVSKVVLVR